MLTREAKSVKLDIGYETRSIGDSILIGDCWEQDSAESIPKGRISDAQTVSELVSIASDLDGFYTIITELESGMAIITDRISSYPLFYYSDGDTVYVSDDQSWVLEHAGESNFSEAAVREYRATTFVAGTETVFDDIYRTEAGEITALQSGDVHRHSHFDFQYTDSIEKDIEEIDTILDNIISRLIQRANGRSIWISLSGGLDSRLLLLKLVEHGYDNVHTFTFGAAGNKESKVAKQIAHELGVPWQFIEYTNDKWESIFRSEDRFDYESKFWCTTVPVILPFLAYHELLESGAMDDTAILISGNSADFLAGSHLDPEIVHASSVRSVELVEEILDGQYRYNSYTNDDRQVYENRIREMVSVNPDETVPGQQACEILERWDWKHRQSEYITADILLGDFFDIEIWLPFWEQSFVDFWLETSIDQRVDQKLYKSYVKEKTNQIMDEPVHRTDRAELPIVERTRRKLSASVLGPLLRPIYQRFFEQYEKGNDTKFAWEEDELCQFGMIGKESFFEHYSGESHIRSFYARQLLGEISFDGARSQQERMN